MGADGDIPSDELIGRIKEYMIKASREAKENTSWISPNNAYEAAVQKFIDGILTRPRGKAFLEDFIPFQRMVSHYGMYNSLSQTLLKVCSPGLPDLYQGTELWDLNLVDPDNRRPVDFEQRMLLLRSLQEAIPSTALAWDLSLTREDGRIKLYTLSRSLTFRRERPELFREGAYLPLEAEGDNRDCICAFERSLKGSSAVIIVPRFLSRLISGTGSVPFSKAVWGETKLVLPDASAGSRYRNVFTGEELVVPVEGWSLPLAEVFTCFPIALLERKS